MMKCLNNYTALGWILKKIMKKYPKFVNKMFLFFSGTILNVIHSNFESYLECLFLSASLLFIVIFTKFSRKSKMK